jgi:hypothetical protein
MRGQALGILAEMSQRLLADGVTTALQRVTDTALQITGADHASIRLCRAGELEVAARSGVGLTQPPPAFKRGQGVLGWVAETGKLARIGDSLSEPRFERRERGYAVASLL